MASAVPSSREIARSTSSVAHAAVTGRSLAGQKLGEAFPHLAVYGEMPITAGFCNPPAAI